MESKKIVLGTAAMENFSAIYRPLLGKGYEFHTTVFVKSASPQISTSAIHSKEFDGTEMEKCLDYIFRNDLESKVGINDATAIYYAMSSNMTLLTTDSVTEKISMTLGVSYISETSLIANLEPDATQQANRKIFSINPNDIQGARLYASCAKESLFKTSICL